MSPRNSFALLMGGILMSGCAGKSAKPSPAVLRTEDFIADPATMPTALPAAPPQTDATPAFPAARPVVPVLEARGGVKEVTVVPGPPAASKEPTTSVDAPTLIDAKVGEINGRSIRVHDMFETTRIGDQLAATARTQTLSKSEWRTIQKAPQEKATRADWLTLARALFRRQLYEILRDELLAAEARAELKPEQRQGLRYIISEATENRRRSLGGSQAELERTLRSESQNAQQFGRDLEAKILVRRQIEQKVEERMRASWKDIVRFYDRHRDEFQPPVSAKFRMIVVTSTNTASVEAVQKALDFGESFEKVASLPLNEYSSPGGLLGDGHTVVGSITETAVFAFEPLNEAARKLTPGKFSPPVTRTDADGKTTLTWLFLESIEDRAKSLSDPDVQLAIFDRLTESAKLAGTAAYIDRLVQRATFSDLDMMTQTLVDIAADRYWPAGK